MLQRLLFTVLSAASLFFLFIKVSLTHWKDRGILHSKPKFLMGNLSGVGHKRHVHSVLQQLYGEYKGRAPFIGCYAFLKPMLLVLDLELVEHVLVKDANNFMERSLHCNVLDDPLSANLMQLDGEQWRRVRTKLKPHFATASMELLLPTLQHVGQTLQRSLEVRLDVHDVLAVNRLVECYNVDVVSALAFGLEGQSLTYWHTEFRQMTASYLKDFNWLRAYFALHFPKVAHLLRYRTYEQRATKYFLELVHDKIRERERDHAQSRHRDFLQLFAESRGRSDAAGRLSEKQITAQLFSFVLIGLPTCNSAMTFCLYELALQPDLQSQVRAEIRHALDEHNGELDMGTLQQMQLLKRVLYETLRMHTPYTFLLRNTTAPYEVPNSVFMLQKDNYLVIPIGAIHHDPSIYPEPNRFDPERFSAAAVRRRHPMAFLPFGAGPRECIAQQFAELQMLLGLATLLGAYTFSPCAETVIPVAYDNSRMVLSPKCDILLKLERV